MIIFAPQAEADLRERLDYLNERSARAADRLLAELDALLADLDAHAFDSTDTQQLSTGEWVQSWPLPPVRVYYQRRGTDLYVLRIYHQRRRPTVRRARRKRR